MPPAVPGPPRAARRPRSPWRDRHPAADVERVEVGHPALQEREECKGAPHAVAPGVDRPELGPHVQVEAAPADRAVRAAARLDDGAHLVRADPELGARDPVARPAWVSASTDGLSRTSASTRRSRPAASGPPRRRAASIARASAAASSANSIATQRSGSPPAAARTAARRSASVLPMPSKVIAAFGDAGPARQRPFAARDDVGAEAARGRESRDERRQVVRLQRVDAQPRVGEGGPDGVGGGIERRPVGDVERRAVAPGGRAQRGPGGPPGGPRSASGGRQSATIRPTIAETSPTTSDPSAAAMIVAWLRISGGKSPTLIEPPISFEM